MILDKRRDVPARLALALKGGVSRERIAQRSGLLPIEARQVVDRLASGTAVSSPCSVAPSATGRAPLSGPIVAIAVPLAISANNPSSAPARITALVAATALDNHGPG